jgi:hypothetical protein
MLSRRISFFVRRQRDLEVYIFDFRSYVWAVILRTQRASQDSTNSTNSSNSSNSTNSEEKALAQRELIHAGRVGEGTGIFCCFFIAVWSFWLLLQNNGYSIYGICGIAWGSLSHCWLWWICGIRGILMNLWNLIKHLNSDYNYAHLMSQINTVNTELSLITFGEKNTSTQSTLTPNKKLERILLKHKFWTDIP